MAQARTNPWLVLLVLTTGFFMILLDTTIVNVAIPAMSTGLNTTLDQILWVLNAYILVYAVLLITAGRLGDLYGQRNLFAIGLFVFTFAPAGRFAIVFGLIEGQRYNWGQVESYPFTIPEVIGAGVMLMILFIIWERFQAEPLVPLSLFADRNFTVANWIAAAISFGMLSAFLPITIYLQSVRGFSALVAGLTLAPMSLTSMFTAPFAGRLSDRIGGKYILMTGIALFTTGIGLIAYIDAMKATFVVPIAFLAFTAVTALLIRGRPRASSTAATEPEEELRAAAG